MKLMKMKWTLLLMAGLSGLAPNATQALDLKPMVVDDVGGTLHIFQALPPLCPDVDFDVPVGGGRLEIAPAEGLPVGGGKRFILTNGTVSFYNFTIHRECGSSVTRAYTQVAVQVAQTVSFVAGAAAGTPDLYTFVIPQGDVRLYETAYVNGALETGYKHPALPVIGTINLGTGAVSMTVSVATKVHVDVLGDYDGMLTASLSGTIDFPDSDGDGVPDRSDNCKFVANADQTPVASPIITAPPDIQVPTCAYALGSATAVDICEGGPVTVTNDAPATFTVGTNTVTWTAEDSHGRTATDTQDVTVVDTTPPVFTFVPPDITMADCGPADLGHPIAVDDCAGTPVLTNDGPPTYGPGTTVVTWTATDAAGNTTPATQTVTVNDVTPPLLSCTLTGKRSDGLFLVTTSDNCPNPVMTLGPYTLANGETIKVTQSPGLAGVDLVGTVGVPPSRFFRVGTGDAVITSTDTSNNSTSVTCLVPPR